MLVYNNSNIPISVVDDKFKELFIANAKGVALYDYLTSGETSSGGVLIPIEPFGTSVLCGHSGDLSRLDSITSIEWRNMEIEDTVMEV